MKIFKFSGSEGAKFGNGGELANWKKKETKQPRHIPFRQTVSDSKGVDLKIIGGHTLLSSSFSSNSHSFLTIKISQQQHL